MKSKSGGALLKRALVASLGAIGVKEAEIRFQNYRIDLPAAGISVSVSLVDGARVWKVENTYSFMRMEDAFETTVTSLLFTVPLEDELLLARRVAVEVAARRIDASLDVVVSQ